MKSESLGILLVSSAHDRAHAAFLLAAAASALGREVVMFSTGRGCRALLEDWSVLDDAGRDAVIRGRGAAGFGELRDAAREVGVRMMACETGLRGEAVLAQDLYEGVEVGGMASFLEAVGAGQMVAL